MDARLTIQKNIHVLCTGYRKIDVCVHSWYIPKETLKRQGRKKKVIIML